MDRLREKIASLRADAEAANEKAEMYYRKIQALEAQSIDQENTITSLSYQNQQLQVDLDHAHEKIAQLKALEEDGDSLQKENGAAQRKITLLEDELANTEKLYREATQNFRQADVKAEHFERKVQHTEGIISNLEAENEELKQKIRSLEHEIHEFHTSLEDI